MRGKVILEGDVGSIQLPDVLSFVSMIRHNGTMLVRQLTLERCIYWNAGDIVFATSNSPEHSLGQFLLRNGKITRQQYEESHQRLTADTRHGKLLVQMGAISPKDLWWGVKNQVLEIIYSLFAWKQGSFVLYEGKEELQERITLSTSTSSIIMEGIRRMDESARIREKIPSLDIVFSRLPATAEELANLEMSAHEIRLFEQIDGTKDIRSLIRVSDLTEFESTRILFQLLSARLIEPVPQARSSRPVFLDVEDSPELLKVVSTYNDMFERLFRSLVNAVGEEQARDIFTNALENSDSNELWVGVFFDQFGRFDENMLIANISELPFEQRKTVLDEGLNTLLSIQLFEVSQHLDAAAKVEIFRFISEQKAELEQAFD
ncbi:MAG: DUF4388 domain-containing protein [Thermoanaerobaculia bacterium]